MKHFIAILLLCLSHMSFSAESADYEVLTPDIEWYVTNIKADTFAISNANELAGLAALVNGTTGFFSPYDFSDKTIVLAGDIDLGSWIDSDGALYGPNWVPIGISYSTKFAGVFDGRGFCLSGLLIRQAGDEMASLFGYNSGTLKNITVAGGLVCSGYYGASICSHNFGVIDHCINTANIVCNNYGGGICGKNYDEGIIRNCFNYGNVANRFKCGGIVGSMTDDSHITNCVYDIQMCPLKRGCGVQDCKYIKGLSTKQIVGVIGYMKDNFIVAENGMYPKLATTQWTPTSTAALAPVFLPEQNNVNNLQREIELMEVAGVSYESSSQGLLEISGKTAAPKKNACVALRIKGGKSVRTINIKINGNNLEQVGTNINPLTISSYSDLKSFADAVNYITDYHGFANIDGFKDVTIVLTSNIPVPDDVNWVPIGTVTNPFAGNFIGFGHCISNLRIVHPLLKHCGFFGYNKGQLRKIVLASGVVIGGDYTGSICGFNDGGIIDKSISAVSVRGHYYTGGLCGYNLNGKMSQLLYLNYVEGVKESTGGICGYCNGGSIEHCVYDWQMAIVDKSVAVIDNEPTISETRGYMTVDMLGNKLESSDGFSFDFQYEENLYPRLMSTEYQSAAVVAATPIFVDKNESVQGLMSFIEWSEREGISFSCNQPSVLKVTSDKAMPLKQGSVVLSITDGTVTKNIIVRIVNSSLPPSGSPDSPLLISNYSDLDLLRRAVNNGTDYKGYACINGFEGVCFKLTNDIVCPNMNQVPIGNYLFPFCGILEGDNHSIKNFNSNYEESDYIGLIGYNSGTIRNLTMSRSLINGRYYNGGICGYNFGRIINCSHDSSTVSGTNYAGGITGFNIGQVVMCSNDGPVQCMYYSGGITGYTNGRVDSCCNRGIITGNSGIGGISGTCASDITNCENRGSVQGLDNTGGIVGRNTYATVQYCVNYGQIRGADCTGGIAGYNDGTVINCSNDSTVNSSLFAGGIVGRGGKIYFCVNKSSVTSNSNNAGGIVGDIKTDCEVKYCINKGPVKAQAFAGGIVADNKGGRVLSCVNYSNVSSSFYTGGICGHNTGNINSCLFYGAVLGGSYVGGICGRLDDGKIENCYYDMLYNSVGGVNGQDLLTYAIGLKHENIIGTTLQEKLLPGDFIFEDFKYPVPKME